MATKNGPVDPGELDLGTLALFTGYALSDAVLSELRAAGHTELRFSHGFLFQHLIEEDRTVGELGARMEVTQQAASKAVAELEELGYLERTADANDGRVRRVRLTKRGRAAVEAARAARRQLGARLARELGAAQLRAAQKTLVRVLELFDAATDVRGRRVRRPE